MVEKQPNIVLFRVLFFAFFISTLFVPVSPLYKGTVYIGALPVWCMYASVLWIPEWSLFAVPCIHTHFWLSYKIAYRFANYQNDGLRFTTAQLMLAISVVSLGFALTMALGPAGFALTYTIFWLGRWLKYLTNHNTLHWFPSIR